MARKPSQVEGADHEGDLTDIDAVKAWIRARREAVGITQEELAAFMGESARAVLNAEKIGDPKAGLPRGYPFFRMLQRLGVVVADAPVPAGPSLHDRLAALEAAFAESVNQTREALELLREARQPDAGEEATPQKEKAQGTA